MKRTSRLSDHIPVPRDLPLPPKGRQPSKVEMEDELDISGMTGRQKRTIITNLVQVDS